ncbi:hypothetical protein B9T36_00535 [Acinetobacter sp. ANC 4204]|uniref:hypothetical protein n=1 Tax=Acinetobacter sp. ANC 4204 TaxID=1977884 RepID=UPI000A32E295|nr:hypothetical protein [Acinetobacter sp. ANC 4204]OTG60937.1 hypothetical protein B9T36_00535 [Acinetobacter sp. ANC 4204]
MAKIIPTNIPVNFQALAEEVVNIPEVVKTVKEIEQFGTDPNIEVELSYEASGNGYTLFYIGYFDYWAIHTPDRGWLRAAIGFDDTYIQTVLERDNYIEAFKAKINSMQTADKPLPIFIPRQLS